VCGNARAHSARAEDGNSIDSFHECGPATESWRILNRSTAVYP
jgi:hypothetical protein